MNRSDAITDESGFTVMELTVACAILLAALAVFFGAIASLQQTSAYQSTRSRSLDDLRLTAGIFAKDARHATGVTSIAADKVVMNTYVNGTVTPVTYEVIVSGAERDLKRTVNGGSQLFVIKLTDASIFSFDSADPATVRRINLHMETQPSTRYPAVVLGTEVSLRNVTA